MTKPGIYAVLIDRNGNIYKVLEPDQNSGGQAMFLDNCCTCGRKRRFDLESSGNIPRGGNTLTYREKGEP